MIKLKGSEKQIAWAEDIRQEKMEDFYYWKDKWVGKWEEQGNLEELAEIEKYTELLENIEDAEKWIAIEKLGLNVTFLINPKRREEVLRYFNGYGIF